jgi:ferrochelatase
VQSTIDTLDWEVEYVPISGWHRHPLYLELRADRIRTFAEERGVDLSDPATRLVFSAHGTPKRYLDDGSRYEDYVQEFCRDVAGRLGVEFVLGYQNHTNRNIEWTQPDIQKALEGLQAERIVVDACSFMHEQSETLAELDIELREEAEGAGLQFHRVPVPHDDPRFAEVMADLVEGSTALAFGPCRCRPVAGTICLNSR